MISFPTRSNLDEEDISLLHIARNASRNCYNKYSGFFVGASLVTVHGKRFSGAFYENASFPVGVCAERVAIGSMITNGHNEIAKMVIVGGADFRAHGPAVTPCGMCRQAISEFRSSGSSPTKIVCTDLSMQNFILGTIDDFLPCQF